MCLDWTGIELIDHTEGLKAASCELNYVEPVCEKAENVSRAMTNIMASLPNNVGDQA